MKDAMGRLLLSCLDDRHQPIPPIPKFNSYQPEMQFVCVAVTNKTTAMAAALIFLL